MKVGLAGLGVMGWWIAANLRRAGHLTVVYNRTREKAVKFSREYNVEVAETPRELFRKADMVITMLSDSDAVSSFVSSVLDDVRGKTLVDMSTIHPSVSVRLAREVESRGGRMYDAPVIGTSVFAQQAKLTVLLGGPKDGREEVEGVLKATAQAVIYVGPNGSGLYAKLVNNLMVGVYVSALAEALEFGLRAGLDHQIIIDVLSKYTSASPTTAGLKLPKMLSGDYSVQFATKHMRKDLEIIQDEAKALKAPTILSSLALQLYRIAENSGYGELDYSSVKEVISRRSVK
ncbi:MAG: NAD(P)-dependent oxidoreductase [Thermoprotei archaeon]